MKVLQVIFYSFSIAIMLFVLILIAAFLKAVGGH